MPAFAAGAITGMQATSRLLDRYGSRRALIPMVVAEGVLLILPALALGGVVGAAAGGLSAHAGSAAATTFLGVDPRPSAVPVSGRASRGPRR